MPPNPQSILDSVKKALGIDSSYTPFDLDVVMHINSVFGSLQQLGVGPNTGFMITDNTTLWTDYTNEPLLLGLVRSFMYMKVRLIFDPPATSFAIEALEKVLGEYEFRLNSAAEFLNPPTDPYGIIAGRGTDDESGTLAGGTVVHANWWDLTGGLDFPSVAVTGDIGYDLTLCELWANNSTGRLAYWWDLTGLSDFPAGSEVGDLGIDMSTGDVWKKTA